MPSDLTKRLRYLVNNPSAWEDFDQGVSDAISEAATEIERLREALRPFAEYMGDSGDLDNKGKPLPGDQGVGWVYLTQADFRRAKAALDHTEGAE